MDVHVYANTPEDYGPTETPHSEVKIVPHVDTSLEGQVHGAFLEGRVARGVAVSDPVRPITGYVQDHGLFLLSETHGSDQRVPRDFVHMITA